MAKRKTTKKATKKKKIKKRAVKKAKSVKKKQKKISKGIIEHLTKKLKGGIEKKEIKTNHISKAIIVEDLMLRNPITTTSNTPLLEAIELLTKYKLRSIIVVEDKTPVGILTEEGVIEYISSFVNVKEETLEENTKKLERLLKKPVSSVMIKIDKFVKKTTPVEAAVKIMNSYEIDQLPVVNKNNELVGTIMLDHILEFIEKSATEKEIVGREVLETGIDKLLDLVESQKEISSKEAAEILKMPLSEVEKFARILREHGLIDIDFSTIGTIKLIKKEREEV
ncbi:MAG: CBS domain-containing protein [Nanoarchaeota archaeon]|nr:CBS domain-containing protein [Nanoarchaeota archaeon]